MKRLAAHIKLRLIQLVREPAFVVSTLIFPSLFFLIFALPNASSPERARLLLGSFASFAVVGVCVFHFGVSFANEIRMGWHSYIRTLPIRASELWLAMCFDAILFALVAAGFVYLTVNGTTEADVSTAMWLKVSLILLLGAIPFALFSAALATWTSAQAALPVFNLIYILGSFAGGLWMPPNALPEKVQTLSKFLPTRHLGELAWAVLLEHEIPWRFVAYLFSFGALSAMVLATRMLWHHRLQKI
ncbi:MAG: ABC transporter permease [Bdellovibrionales bacterium]